MAYGHIWHFRNIVTSHRLVPSCLSRSRLTLILARRAKCGSWPGLETASGCPSDWIQLCACSTPTPTSTSRTWTSSPTSARCWVRTLYSAYNESLLLGILLWLCVCVCVCVHVCVCACVCVLQVRVNWASPLWESQLWWCPAADSG